MSTYSLSPKQTKQAIEVAIKANTPVLVSGSGGIGKSSVIKQIAEDYNLQLIDIRLSQVTRYDLLGYPQATEVNAITGYDSNGYPIIEPSKRMEYVPLMDLPLDTDELPQGKDGWILFLDELLQADKYVQGSAFKLILDRMVGSHNIHPNVRIVAATNGALNSTADNKMIAPLKSRFTHIEMVAEPEEFKQYVESQVMLDKWDARILGFINFKPEHINNYDSKVINDVQTYSCPRTIEMLSNQINSGLLALDEDVHRPVIVGIIGEYAGNDFIDFLSLYGSLPTIQEIEQDPSGAVMPTEVGAQWALSSLLLQGITSTNESKIATYIERIQHDDIKVVLYRSLIRKCPTILNNPLVQQSMGILKTKLNRVNFGLSSAQAKAFPNLAKP